MPRPSSQTDAPAAKKSKGIAGHKLKRHIKRESARAARIRAEPVRGISARRIKVYGRQHMIFSIDTSGIEAVRTILAAASDKVLQQAIILASGNRRRSLRRSDILEAYERATTRNHQLLHAPFNSETPEARGRAKETRRRIMQRALADGTATLDSRRAAPAEEEDEDEEEDAYVQAEEQESDSDIDSDDAVESDAESDGDNDDENEAF